MKIENYIRKIIQEQEFALKPGLKEYLDSLWLSAHYDSILSILEGVPNSSAIIDIENQISFDNRKENIKNLSTQDGMELYFKENGLPQEVLGIVLSFVA